VSCFVISQHFAKQNIVSRIAGLFSLIFPNRNVGISNYQFAFFVIPVTRTAM
jgi:hypothetical protein